MQGWWRSGRSSAAMMMERQVRETERTFLGPIRLLLGCTGGNRISAFYNYE